MEEDPNKFWEDCFSTLRKWRKEHPAHAPKLYKITKTIESMQIQYKKNINDYTYKKNPSALERAISIKQEAEDLVKKLSKLELLASLSK